MLYRASKEYKGLAETTRKNWSPWLDRDGQVGSQGQKGRGRIVGWQVLSWIGQTLASSALAILAYVAVRSTAIGERFLNHRLEQKIADQKHVHDEQIEELRAELGHLQDRGRRANELEFEAISKIWHAFVDAHMKVQQAIIDYMSFPDLNKLGAEDVAAFLEGGELAPQQRKQVIDAPDKVRMYSKIMRLRKINSAGSAIYDGRLLLRTNGIHIHAAMADAFRNGFSMLSEAYAEQSISFEHGAGVGNKASMALVGGEGDKLFAAMETLVRTTIRRDVVRAASEQPPNKSG